MFRGSSFTVHFPARFLIVTQTSAEIFQLILLRPHLPPRTPTIPLLNAALPCDETRETDHSSSQFTNFKSVFVCALSYTYILASSKMSTSVDDGISLEAISFFNSSARPIHSVACTDGKTKQKKLVYIQTIRKWQQKQPEEKFKH